MIIPKNKKEIHTSGDSPHPVLFKGLFSLFGAKNIPEYEKSVSGGCELLHQFSGTNTVTPAFQTASSTLHSGSGWIYRRHCRETNNKAGCLWCGALSRNHSICRGWGSFPWGKYTLLHFYKALLSSPFCKIATISSVFSTLPNAATFPSTTKAGVLITP